MKVLLINPPIFNLLVGDSPKFLDEERGYNPPLGLMYLASYAKKYSNHEIEILDTQVEELNFEQIKERIKRGDPDVVGIEVMTFTLLDVIETIKIIKEVNKDIKIVLGGPHVNIFPIESINNTGVDCIILGEGEKIFTELLNNFDSKQKLKKIKGLIFTEDKKIINTGVPDLIEKLDELPFPAREITPYKKYSSVLAKRSPVTTMITSRGCPFQCTYCFRPHLGKKFRAHSAQYVFDEIRSCIDLGIHEALIYDDTFTVDKKRVHQICDLLIEKNIDFGWDIRARVDTVDKELLNKLKKAGCERVHYGVEAGVQKIINELNKGITLQQALDAFKETKKAGIETLAYFMIGNPTETRTEIKETLDFAKKLNPDFVSFSVTVPFPSTALYARALQEKVIKTDVWKEYAKNPTKEFQSPLWTKELSREELLNWLNFAYKDFYSRPSYILKKMMKIRSVAEFKRKMKAGLRVLKL